MISFTTAKTLKINSFCYNKNYNIIETIAITVIYKTSIAKKAKYNNPIFDREKGKANMPLFHFFELLQSC